MRDSILWQWSSEYLHSCESGDSKHYLYTWCLILNGCLYQFSLLYDPSLMYIVLGFKLANIHDSIMRWGWKFFIQKSNYSCCIKIFQYAESCSSKHCSMNRNSIRQRFGLFPVFDCSSKRGPLVWANKSLLKQALKFLNSMKLLKEAAGSLLF